MRDKGGRHCATFCMISPAEKGHPNGSREVDEHAKLNMWNNFQPILLLDPGENPGKGPKWGAFCNLQSLDYF